MNFFQSIFSLSFLIVVIRFSTPILFASISCYSASITGIGNIAVESIMTLSALFSILGSYWTQSAVLGVLIGLAMGILLALMIAFFSMKLGANPFLVGVALNTFADSLAIFILYIFTGDKGSSASLKAPTLGSWNIPLIKDIPVLGQILSGHYVTTYVCWLAMILLYILVFKTPLGMRMRACGLNAEAAKTAGINVQKLQVLSLVLSGAFAALGGIYLSMNYIGLFSKGMVGGMGWMGVAANGIANGNYGSLLISGLVFGIFRTVAIRFSSSTVISTYLVGAIPYFAVFVGLILISIINTMRIKRGNVEEQ